MAEDIRTVPAERSLYNFARRKRERKKITHKNTLTDEEIGQLNAINFWQLYANTQNHYKYEVQVQLVTLGF